MLDQDILEALRRDEQLCPKCLGQKRRRWHSYPDWSGDPERGGWQKCPTCKGTGLEDRLKAP